MPAALPSQGRLLQFRNCCILRNHKIYRDDLWVRDGKIIDPEKVFFDERIPADIQIDCENSIIAPGYIDVQINGRCYFSIQPFFSTPIVHSGDKSEPPLPQHCIKKSS